MEISAKITLQVRTAKPMEYGQYYVIIYENAYESLPKFTCRMYILND